ncbi:MAG TPA: ABC transporter ATP-binding protein, partial [Pseudonocardiaceae bacterium]|nr:ABC transporter ATP-binding protein [Pseudonocardiaceae bacterium]
MTALLEVSGVTKSFGGLRALSNCSFEVAQGSITGLIGPNGSGKTTVFNVITGYERADSGMIRFDGRDVSGVAMGKVGRLGLGRTFQLTRVFGRLNLLDNIRVGSRGVPRSRRAELYSDERCHELLDFVELTDLAHEQAGSLSYGQRKLLELAMVLAQDPSVILLDEPAGGINPVLIAQMSERIVRLNEQGVTFLLVEHNMEFVMDICDTVAVLEHGSVIAMGEPEVIRNDPRVL